jgi:hypothetical protein
VTWLSSTRRLAKSSSFIRLAAMSGRNISLDDSGVISGQSPSGRAAVRLLKFDRPEQIEIRGSILIDFGLYPSESD